MTDAAWDLDTRRALAAEIDRLSGLDPAQHPSRNELLGQYLAAYRAGLPRVALSRDPVSGEVFHHSFDAVGLDGPWWDADGTGRVAEPLLPTVIGFTGAMRLAAEIEVAAHRAYPGPEVPVVIPRLLRHDGVHLVVSQVDVGRHVGWCLLYVAESKPEGEQLPNDWGLKTSLRVGPDGSPRWDQAFDFDVDPDLRQWMATGRVHWIAPGDTTLTLRRDVDGCPYLDLEGSTLSAWIDHGHMWRA